MSPIPWTAQSDEAISHWKWLCVPVRDHIQNLLSLVSDRFAIKTPKHTPHSVSFSIGRGGTFCHSIDSDRKDLTSWKFTPRSALRRSCLSSSNLPRVKSMVDQAVIPIRCRSSHGPRERSSTGRRNLLRSHCPRNRPLQTVMS